MHKEFSSIFNSDILVLKLSDFPTNENLVIDMALKLGTIIPDLCYDREQDLFLVRIGGTETECLSEDIFRRRIRVLNEQVSSGK